VNVMLEAGSAEMPVGAVAAVGERELGTELDGLAAESLVLVQQRPDALPKRSLGRSLG
jgi:hypothetical protein